MLATCDDSLPTRRRSIDYRSMMSLRAKVTLALLVTSLGAIALFGLTARGLILSRFDDLVIDQAFQGFSPSLLLSV